jgi:hypothetical protein
MKMTLLERIAAKLCRHYWLTRIDVVLNHAREKGLIDSWLLHELDGRLKYGDPFRAFPRRPHRAAPSPPSGKEGGDGS